MNKHFLKALAVAAAMTAVSANAALINNGSFEQDPSGSIVYSGNAQNKPINSFSDYGTLGAGYSWAVVSSIPGWNLFYGPGVEVQFSNTLGFPAQDGSRYLEMDTHFSYNAPGNSNAGIFQQLDGLTAGATYELSFWYRSRTTLVDDNGLGVFWQPAGTAMTSNDWSYKYDYYDANNQVVGSTTAWQNYKINLVANSTSMLIGFGGLGDALWGGDTNKVGGGSAKGALLDNVSLTAVSAPATFGLFGLALVGLLLRRRIAK